MSVWQVALKRASSLSTAQFVALQVVATLLALVLLLEAWSWFSPPKDKIVWPTVQDAAVGTRFKANTRVLWTNGLDFRVDERTNEAGFLDRPLPPIPRKPGTCRIALIGDSFVEAAQVPIGQKAQVLIEGLMKTARPQYGGVLGVETMAFGFSGTGQLNQLGYLEAHVRPRKPDLIVLVFVSNDFANNSALLEAIRGDRHPAHTSRIFARETAAGAVELQPIDPDWSSHRLPATGDGRPWLHTTLHKASRFYRWLYAKLTLQYPGIARWMGQEPTEAEHTAARVAAISGLDPTYARQFAGWDVRAQPNIDLMFAEPGPLPPVFEQALRFTGFAFDTFKARAAADGARLAVLATHEVKGVREVRLRKLLAERDIPLISMPEHIARQGGKITDAHWRHDGHWSPQGHIWAAEAIVEHMAKAGVCGSK